MIKAILLSNRSKYSYLIMVGEKKYEVRKSKLPQGVPIYNYVTQAKPYITKQSNSQFTFRDSNGFTNLLNGSIPFRFKVGEIIEAYFTKNGYESLFVGDNGSDDIGEYDLRSMSCLNTDELEDYGKGKTLYFHEIIDLEIFDKPMQLHDFYVKEKSEQYGFYTSTEIFDDELCEWMIPIKKAPQSKQWVWIKEN